MFDPQYHTEERGRGGIFDRGQIALEQFKQLHSCNRWCSMIGLRDLSLPPARPKRPKPTPRNPEKLYRAPTPHPDDLSTSPHLKVSGSSVSSALTSLENANAAFERELDNVID
jgi:hypothetical protein